MSDTNHKQVHPNTGISNKAMAILNSFINDILEHIARGIQYITCQQLVLVLHFGPSRHGYLKQSDAHSQQFRQRYLGTYHHRGIQTTVRYTSTVATIVF